MVQVECIARGYLAGLGLKEYQARGTVSGVELSEGLREGDRLPEPIFTPTTKATEGHDEFIDFDDVVAQEGADVAEQLGLPVGSPVLRGRNWYYDTDGGVIEYGESAATAGVEASVEYGTDPTSGDENRT